MSKLARKQSSFLIKMLNNKDNSSKNWKKGEHIKTREKTTLFLK